MFVQQVDYNTSSLISVGLNPRQVVTGDLDGDGFQDAVVLNGSASNSSIIATVLINDQRGNLSPFNNVSFNFSASDIKLADLNQDGALDLAVSSISNFSGGQSALVVYFNNGNGIFTSQNTFNFPGSSSVALGTGDFNGDGANDIAVATIGGNNTGFVSIFLNNGFGNFNLAGNLSVGGGPRDLKVADFNGDGISDVVTVNNNSTGSLLLGNSSGNFQLATNFSVTATNLNSSSLIFTAGDLNNDNRPDLVISSFDSNTFAVLLNNGVSFATPVQTTFSDFTVRIRSLTIGQVVGDGNSDIIFGVGGSSSDSISEAAILTGNGSGTFTTTSPTIAPTGSSPGAVVIADFNNDNRNDIITANAFSNDVSVLLNNNDKFGPSVFATSPNSSLIAAADFNGDGNLDTIAAATQTFGSPNFISSFLISFGDGRGGISSTRRFGPTNGNQAIITTDFNNDSRPDLIAATNNGSNTSVAQLSIYLNNGTPQIFPFPESFTVSLNFPVRNLVVGDFNNDGRKDIVVSSSTSNTIALLLGTSGGNVASPILLAAPVSAPVVTAGDFNNDGNLDLAVAGNNTSSSGSGAIFILLGGGNGSFTQVSESVSVFSPNSITSGDFNGDSISDIAVTTVFNGFNNSSSIGIVFGTGSGRFSLPTYYAVGQDAKSIMAVDFNGDNRPDLIAANRASNSFSVLINNGNGNFSQASNFLAGIFPEAIAVGDFDKDGRNDVVTANRGGINFSIITNSCQEAVTKTDYNGEGRSDFAVFRPSNNTWYVLTNNLNINKIQQFGSSTDILTPGDYDGDGITDFAVYRPSNGTWYVLRSSTNRAFAVPFGTEGDIPVANDYDGDGRTDIAVYRPSNGTWYIRQTLTFQSQVRSVQFGAAADRPVPADYDGDGRADVAVFRPSNGTWYYLGSQVGFRGMQFGVSTDVTVPGDYDGDGKTDIAVFREGIWYIFQSLTNSFRAENFGATTDRPQPADYDGDGKTDVAVWRPTNGNWYIIRSSDRQIRAVKWGETTDIPVTSLYIR